MAVLERHPHQHLFPEEKCIKLSALLCKLSGHQIKEGLSDQDNQYLLKLSNKALALEHYEVCSVIADIVQENINPVF